MPEARFVYFTYLSGDAANKNFSTLVNNSETILLTSYDMSIKIIYDDILSLVRKRFK